MLQYTLQMSSEDSGGLTEYVEFFSNLREVFSIADQRKELTSELRYSSKTKLLILCIVVLMMILGMCWPSLSPITMKSSAGWSCLIESMITNWKLGRWYSIHSLLSSHVRYQCGHFNSQSRADWAFAAIALPVAVISGIFGMNNTDTPISIPFDTLMIVAAAVSVWHSQLAALMSLLSVHTSDLGTSSSHLLIDALQHVSILQTPPQRI